MKQNYTTESKKLIRAKKRVKKIKGFYIHLTVFIFVNLFLSGLSIYYLIESGYNFHEALTKFNTYSTVIFWGIGLFFHWMGVFGFKSLISKNWEEKKIKEIMDKDRF